jgi:hypothetical protein
MSQQTSKEAYTKVTTLLDSAIQAVSEAKVAFFDISDKADQADVRTKVAELSALLKKP